MVVKQKAIPVPLREMVKLPTELQRRHSTFGMVKVSDLLIDTSYQRQTSSQRVNRMVREFNPDLIGVLVVSKRDNGYIYLIDGQHRKEMLEKVPNAPKEIFAEIFEGLSIEEEAKLFYLLDTRRAALTSGAAWVARKVAKEPLVLEIEAVLNSVGLTCEYHLGASATNIRAYDTVESMFRRIGPEGLREVLSIAHAAWPNDDKALTGFMLTGLEEFLKKFGDSYTSKHLITSLSRYTPINLVAQARQIQSVAGSMGAAVGMTIYSIYNRNLRTNRLDDWFAS